jgi:hypothetical protein
MSMFIEEFDEKRTITGRYSGNQNATNSMKIEIDEKIR